MSDDFDEGVHQDENDDEEQHPARPADREPPPGRRAESTEGAQPECLDHIGVVWTDRRPVGPRSHRDRTILR
ncbi:MAG: MbtH family protein [Actinoallomurus sp.]